MNRPAQVKLQFTMKHCHVFNRVKFVDNQDWESLGDKTFFCKFLKTNIVTGTNASQTNYLEFLLKTKIRTINSNNVMK